MAYHSGSRCGPTLFEPCAVRSRSRNCRAPSQPRPAGRSRPCGISGPTKKSEAAQDCAKLFVEALLQTALNMVAVSDDDVVDLESVMDETFEQPINIPDDVLDAKEEDYEEVLSLCSDMDYYDLEVEESVHMELALQFTQTAVKAGLSMKLEESTQEVSQPPLAKVRPWKLRPSVGTWFMMPAEEALHVPQQPCSPAEPCQITPEVQVHVAQGRPWRMQSSVGTWYLVPNEETQQPKTVEETPVNLEQASTVEQTVAPELPEADKTPSRQSRRIIGSMVCEIPKATPEPALQVLKLRNMTRNPSAPTLAGSVAGSLRKAKKDGFLSFQDAKDELLGLSPVKAKKAQHPATGVSAMALDLGVSAPATPPSRSSSVGALRGIQALKISKQDSFLQSLPGATEWSFNRSGQHIAAMWAA